MREIKKNVEWSFITLLFRHIIGSKLINIATDHKDMHQKDQHCMNEWRFFV
jgi:hypothetical protein